MSETSAETKTENNVEVQEKEEPTPRRAKRTSSIASKLAKEAEAILKGFGDKEDAPEGRRTTRSFTRGSVVPPASTPPPAKKERKSSTNLNNSPASRRGRPKKGSGDDAKPNNDEQKEEETNNGEPAVVSKEPTQVDDVEMKDKNIPDNSNKSGDTITDVTDAKNVKTDTNLEDATKESVANNSVAENKGGNENLSDADATTSVRTSCTNVSSTGSTSTSVTSVVTNTTASTTISNASSSATTANGTVDQPGAENACKRINQDAKVFNELTETSIKSEEIVKKASPTVIDDKVSGGEKITSPTPLSDESNKSVNNSSEVTANQSSTLSSND